jgi:hypothetical protein
MPWRRGTRIAIPDPRSPQEAGVGVSGTRGSLARPGGLAGPFSGRQPIFFAPAATSIAESIRHILLQVFPVGTLRDARGQERTREDDREIKGLVGTQGDWRAYSDFKCRPPTTRPIFFTLARKTPGGVIRSLVNPGNRAAVLKALRGAVARLLSGRPMSRSRLSESALAGYMGYKYFLVNAR